jgi:hypothetical protein
MMALARTPGTFLDVAKLRLRFMQALQRRDCRMQVFNHLLGDDLASAALTARQVKAGVFETLESYANPEAASRQLFDRAQSRPELLIAFGEGVSAFADKLIDSPHLTPRKNWVADKLTEIMIAPNLGGHVTSQQVTRMTSKLLSARGDVTSYVGDVMEAVTASPRERDVRKALPQLEAMVTYGRGQTGIGYPMVMQLAPSGAELELFVGCRGPETPLQRAKVWFDHAQHNRRSRGFPLLFEACGKMLEVKAARPAARRSLSELGDFYSQPDVRSELPETARKRIDYILSPGHT